MTQQPQTGDRVNNYILEVPVGSGSFGEVWRARHHIFDERVAIKIPTDPQFVRNLQREGRTVHGVRHPNIVRALDLDPYADPPYYIMEYVDGPSLREIIDAHPKGLPIVAVMPILRGIVLALQAAHDHNLVHRDIKPANILVAGGADLDGMTPERVKVTDFGLGQVGGVTTASIMQSGSMVTEEGKSIAGTLAYMAPEQRDGHDVDARCDLYSAAVVLFEMLTGVRPQGGDRPSEVREGGAPPFYDELFLKGYTRIERRFASAAEMLTLLDDADRYPPTVASGASTRSASTGTSRPPTRAVAGPSGLCCPACHGLVDRRDQFCIYCGQQLVEQVPRCPSCQGYVQRTDNYCIFCGADVRLTT
jgi:serine/threonine-protein kinase